MVLIIIALNDRTNKFRAVGGSSISKCWCGVLCEVPNKFVLSVDHNVARAVVADNVSRRRSLVG